MSEIKVLIGFRESDYEIAKRGIKLTIKDIQPVIDKINSINSYKVNQAGLDNLLYGHGELVSDGIESATLSDLEKANISSSGLKQSATKADLESLWDIINEFKERFRPNKWTSLIKIQDGKVLIPEDIIENDIRDQFCNYITTEAGLIKKQEYDAFIEAANIFLKDNTHFKSIRSVLEYNVEQLNFDTMTQPIVDPFRQ